jgi:hypothetical protein
MSAFPSRLIARNPLTYRRDYYSNSIFCIWGCLDAFLAWRLQTSCCTDSCTVWMSCVLRGNSIVVTSCWRLHIINRITGLLSQRPIVCGTGSHNNDRLCRLDNSNRKIIEYLRNLLMYWIYTEWFIRVFRKHLKTVKIDIQDCNCTRFTRIAKLRLF